MKIVGFTQLRNELKNGNLENWFRCMDMCSHIYIWDQASDDGSQEFYKKIDKAVVVENPTNDFANENLCKDKLLKKLLAEQPDTDWILWMDGDYLLDGRYQANDFQKFFEMCERGLKEGIDGFSFGHYNLWRSDNRYRIDNMYHASHAPGRISLWRNNGKLQMNTQPGLHKSPLPTGIDKVERVDCNLIHRGFATDEQIINKYLLYRSFGQKGWELSRLINEKGLRTEKLPDGLLPSWFELNDGVDPTTKTPLVVKYRQVLS